MNRELLKKVVLLSFATPDYLLYQKNLERSARGFGISRFISKTFKDLLQTDFYQQHQQIFEEKRGVGYWLWKPFFVLEALQQLDDDEILFYADSGCEFIDTPVPLVDLCNKSKTGVVAFDSRPIKESEYTKRDAFILMNADEPRYWDSPQIIATSFLFKKNAFTIRLVKDWLMYATDKRCISDATSCLAPESPAFKDHRHDQSIFSLLLKKRGIETYRSPAKWGNYLKLPEYRVPGEWVGYPYDFERSIVDYATSAQENSPYGTILEFNRKAHRPLSSTNVFKRVWRKIAMR